MIQLGKAIYSILSNNSAIAGYVGTKIFPVIIPQETTLPIIVYERSGNANYTRDGISTNDSNLDITILSSKYTESVDIAQSVLTALNNYHGTVQGINVIDIRLTSVSETYQDEAYIQKLSFEVKSV